MDEIPNRDHGGPDELLNRDHEGAGELLNRDHEGAELSTMIQEIRDRVRARHPNGDAPGAVPLAQLMPLLHARDAAEAKVASIGMVNPRRGGPLNALAQGLKRLVARALDWHVREQVEFNRGVINCVQNTLEAFNETNRALSVLAVKIEQNASEFRLEARELKDIRSHWAQWRPEWEHKLLENEARFLRSVAELQAAFQHRVTLLDETNRERVLAQHAQFEATVAKAVDAVHQRFWADLDRIRDEYAALIHAELRTVRQRIPYATASAGAAQPAEFDIDWLKFAEKFRGQEEHVRQHQRIYAERFANASGVLDLGCGRGELLEVFRDAGISAHGIDLNEDCLAVCKAKGLAVEKADLFTYLSYLPNETLGGAVCAQVVEHLPPERVLELVRLLHAKLKPGAQVAIETPNPECLAIFATHFYIDPTHTRPIPPVLLAFYLEETGFHRIEVARLYPAMESIPSVRELPEAVRNQFFGGMDYAIFARKV